MVTLNKRLIIYILLSITSFIIDQLTSDCEVPSLKGYLINFFHHFGSNYLYFGSILFGNYDTHLLIIAATYAGWALLGWKCFLTMYYNRGCNIPIERPHEDIVYRLLKIMPINAYNVIYTLILYDLYNGNILKLKI